jgi:branched-chain amino acid transport system substrate-binding protein
MSVDRMSRRKWLGCAAAAFCAALTAGQAAAQAGRLAGQEVRIGAIVPSSGPFAEWGRTNTVALKMLENEINASGGVDGAKLRIFVYDDASRPPQAANLVRRLAEDDKVLAIAGPLTSSAVEVAFPVANQMKVVATSQASSKPGVAALNRPWGFRNTVDEMVLGRASVPYFKSAYKVSTVAVIYDAKDANSVALGGRIMPGLMKENGIKVLNEASLLTFNTGDIDVSAQVTTLRSLNPDGIVVAADYSQAITVIRELKRQGVMKPVIGGTPLIAAATLKAAPEIPVIAPGTFFFADSTVKGPMEKFAASLLPLLRQTQGLPAEIEPSMYDANIYEIVTLYLDAVRKTGVTLKPDELAQDREKIRKFVETGSFQGFAGKVSFSKEGEASKSFFVVVGKDGKWTEGARGCSAPGGKGC